MIRPHSVAQCRGAGRFGVLLGLQRMRRTPGWWTGSSWTEVKAKQGIGFNSTTVPAPTVPPAHIVREEIYE